MIFQNLARIRAIASFVAKARNGKQLRAYLIIVDEKIKASQSIAGGITRNPKEARAFRVSKELDAGAKRRPRARATIKFLYL